MIDLGKIRNPCSKITGKSSMFLEYRRGTLGPLSTHQHEKHNARKAQARIRKGLPSRCTTRNGSTPTRTPSCFARPSCTDCGTAPNQTAPDKRRRHRACRRIQWQTRGCRCPLLAAAEKRRPYLAEWKILQTQLSEIVVIVGVVRH